jgi:hypothetical protein
MAEDSGAFKTNPAKSRQLRHFVIITAPLQSSLTDQGNCPPARRAAQFHRIVANAAVNLAVSSNQPDSRRAGGCPMRRERG